MNIEFQSFCDEFIKIAITLNDVELVKKSPDSAYGKARESAVGAVKGGLTGAGVASLLTRASTNVAKTKRNVLLGAGLGAGSYLADRTFYGQGEKLAGLGSMNFSPGKALANNKAFANLNKPVTSVAQPTTAKVGLAPRINSAGPKVTTPFSGNLA